VGSAAARPKSSAAAAARPKSPAAAAAAGVKKPAAATKAGAVARPEAAGVAAAAAAGQERGSPPYVFKQGQVGTDGQCSPRHRMPRESRNKGSIAFDDLAITIHLVIATS
jgi:hypothetical protein